MMKNPMVKFYTTIISIDLIVLSIIICLSVFLTMWFLFLLIPYGILNGIFFLGVDYYRSLYSVLLRNYQCKYSYDIKFYKEEQDIQNQIRVEKLRCKHVDRVQILKEERDLEVNTSKLIEEAEKELLKGCEE